MSHIIVIAFPVAPVGKEQELLAEFAKLVPATRAELGCLSFVVHQHPQIANRLAVYEKFANQADFNAHLEYPHTQAFVAWIQSSGTQLNFEQWDEQTFS